MVSEDWVVRYNNRQLQLERQSSALGAGEKPRAGAGKRSRGYPAIHYRGQPVCASAS